MDTEINQSDKNHASLLLEIGTEEIPARFIPDGVKSLKDALLKFFEDTAINFGNVSEYATPRRLALVIEDVAEKQKDRTKEIAGPPKKIAFDEKGNPTQAAVGFAKSCNVDVKELKTVRTERGEYLSVTISETGRKTIDVLSEALPKLISSVQFPKSMRWGGSVLRFARPIRWITAMLGAEVISFELDGLKSSNKSFGHRFISPGPFDIKDPVSYKSILAENGIIADPAERRGIILDETKKIESKTGGKVHEDAELLNTVTFLVEYPTVIMGDFDPAYLSLPKELIVTVMRSHQKYFSMEDKAGNLMPHFVLVSNTKSENSATVKRGAERVLRARLEDARFYYNEDRKKPLWDYVEKLNKVTFHEKLGSLYEKAERIAFLSSYICDELGTPAKENALKAAMLAKADLVTGVVREFPELQGYMGMVYAGNSGEDDEVAAAIYEHYLPRFSGDILPSGEAGSIISIADKIDNIASFFLLGLAPTGSEDPFALRRQAMGVINILIKKDNAVSLEQIIDKAVQGLENYLPSRKPLDEEILKFFYQRFEGMLLNEGYAYDVIDSVFSAKGRGIRDIKQRVETLSDMREMPGFPELVTAAKRVYNILAKIKAGQFNADMPAEPAEKELHQAVMHVNKELTWKNYNALFELKEPVNNFFEKVLVMDKDPAVKANRLALLLTVKDAFNSLGDFSKIVG